MLVGLIFGNFSDASLVGFLLCSAFNYSEGCGSTTSSGGSSPLGSVEIGEGGGGTAFLASAANRRNLSLAKMLEASFILVFFVGDGPSLEPDLPKEKKIIFRCVFASL